MRRLFDLWNCAVDVVPGSTRGSKSRNFLTYVIVSLAIALTVELFFELLSKIKLGEIRSVAWVFCWVAFGYFGMTTLGVIRLISDDFQLSPRRLGRDIFVSASFTVVAFAFYYAQAGIVDTASPAGENSPSDYLYFSTVTFSTLGYGDFRPDVPARLMAAFQAVLGNLHLGLVVGAVYLAIETLSRPQTLYGYRATSKPRTKIRRQRRRK